MRFLFRMILLASVTTLFGFVIVRSAPDPEIQKTVEALSKKISLQQVRISTPAVPPFVWGKYRGIYESDVRQYFHGKPDYTAFRYALKIFDNNMFATAWITTALLESYRYGTAPKPKEEQIRDSLVTIMGRHRNKNLNYTNSIMAFWPQIYNTTDQRWQSTPENLLGLFNATGMVDWNTIYPEMIKLGLGDIVNAMKGLLGSKYEDAFRIPPDADDTSVNLGLGSLLKDLSADFPEEHLFWETENTNLTSIFHAIKYYAYRPMSSDRRVNTIETRTYFYMRKYLEKCRNEKKDLALVTTWLQDLDEVRTEYYKGVHIPGNVNNVDVTVAANAIYGITNSILTGLVTAEILEDKELQQVYINTTSMIAFEINTNFSGRPDLALTYYPSETEFYWFVARTFNQLNRRYKAGGLPHVVLEQAMDILGSSLKNHATQRLLNLSTEVNSQMAYYDDFLGNGDTDQNGDPIKYAEDRMFTSAMAVNALLTTWTYYDDVNDTLHWDTDTSVRVKNITARTVNYLNKYILSGDYQLWNVFFTGSFKGRGSYWNEFPANRDEYLNGTVITDKKKVLDDGIRGVMGVANSTWYEAEMKVLHSTIDFHGYNNNGEAYFPFWCSEPYTNVVAMLALSTFNNIEKTNKLVEMCS